MDAQPSVRADSILHRIFRRPSPAEASPSLATMAAQAVVMGLASAYLELAVMFAHRGIVGTVTRVSYRVNWHHAPMGILAKLGLFAVGFAVVAMLWIRPSRRRWVEPAATTLGWFVAVVSPLLAIEELYWPCGVVLAGAIAVRVRPWWTRSRASILRPAIAILGGIAGIVVVGGFAWQQTSESRALASLSPAKSDAPNVVMLVLDTVRADHLSLHGYARETSPFLERLADRAVVFDFARAPAPWTLPSHATMFTGRWPHELSVDIDRPLDRTHPTIAEFLATHGYATAGFTGNVFYNNAWFGLDRGFAHYEDARENQEISLRETLRSTAIGRALMPLAVRAKLWGSTAQFPNRKQAEAIRNDAISWVDRRPAGRPFFVFLNYFDAHDPYTVPAGFPVKYSWEDRAAVRQAYRRYTGNADEDDARQEHKTSVDPALTGIMIDAYDDCIRYVDDQIARLFDDLAARGLDRNTWVIVTADHGEQFGEHEHYRHGGSLYRSAIDVPLLIIPPSGSRMTGARVADPVSPRDLPATIADLAGLGESSPFAGQSLRAYWDASASRSPDDEVPLSELKIPRNHLRETNPAAIDKYKTSLVDRDQIYHRSPIDAEELYDVADREEQHNLAPVPAHAKRLDPLRTRIEALRKSP